MSNDEKIISDIYGISIEVAKNICPTEEWYINLLKKKPEDINMCEITKMLIHNTFLETAIEMAIKILEDDYMAGEFYDGHLLKLLSNVELGKYNSQVDNLRTTMNKIKKIVKEDDWDTEEDYNEYVNNLNKSLELLK
ncbi:contact-dependent growth inhibition system immunity protein [Hathewaya histolytica]|uniref:Uncharacterized protein n=1 Tax=Hathewaya histolytica TaxID=1498 RepID=A0A4U9QZ70_HATHI|nr:contact-dependent growth inhibition system immunity protein [Hathewaya histolytica]VTQ84244.1 Uncharacterised protein [Hathewaya histolytica]